MGKCEHRQGQRPVSGAPLPHHTGSGYHPIIRLSCAQEDILLSGQIGLRDDNEAPGGSDGALVLWGVKTVLLFPRRL